MVASAFATAQGKIDGWKCEAKLNVNRKLAAKSTKRDYGEENCGWMFYSATFACFQVKIFALYEGLIYVVRYRRN